MSYFFFQAEDGIRDYKVTGVRRVLFRSELLDDGKIVNPAASKDILEILKMQQDNSGIRRHTPDDIPVANKSGALDALRSDVEIGRASCREREWSGDGGERGRQQRQSELA